MTATPTQTVAPQSVVTSYRLHIAGAVIGLVVAIISVATLSQTIAATKAALARTNTSGTTIDVNALATGSAIGGAVLASVIAVAFAILTILFARKMLAGRNWARIVLTVFAGLQVFGILGAYGVGALHFIVLLAAVIFSFLADSNAYFRSLSAGPSGTV